MAILHTTASLFVAAVGMAFASARMDLDDVMPGLWTTQTAVTGEVMHLLPTAAANVSCYVEEVENRICLVDVEVLETQELSGTNYKFRVAGCNVTLEDELGTCRDLNCTSTPYEVVASTLNDTMEATSILVRA